MTQNDKRNAKISEVCRVLANACMSENTTLYPEDVMTFVNESRNSDIKELLALHMALNEIDATRRLEKNIECMRSWNTLEQGYNADVALSLLQVKIEDNNRIIESREKEAKDFETAFEYLETMDALVLEYEIDEYEKILEAERDIKEAFDIKTDNDIAVETVEELEKEEYNRQLAIDRIATDAYHNEISTETIIRFMQEKLADNSERALFLEKYANAAHTAAICRRILNYDM